MNGGRFDAYSAGYAPLAQGIEHRPLTGFEGLPFVNNPVLGTLAPFLTPTAQSMMNGVGMTPMGLSGRNISHTMRNMRYTEHQNQILQDMAKRDRENVVTTLRGAAALAGKDWNADRQQAANTFADAYSSFAPAVAAMSTDAIDAVTGGTSALALGVGLTAGARYRADPMSGLPGTSAGSASHLVAGLHEAYFKGGRFDRGRNFGHTSGQIGALFDEMSRRGMVAGVGTPESAAMGGISMMEQNDSARFQRMLGDSLGSSRAEEIRKSAATAGTDITSQLKGAELEKLAKTGDAESSIRQFDVSRVKSSIDKYAKLTGAMRDIFGDSGRPDAPMAELLQGLEALTNGSLQQYGSGQAEMLVRTIYGAAKNSGVGLEGAMMVQASMAQAASQMGLNPAAAPLMTRDVLRGIAAAQQSGAASIDQWGMQNAEQLGQAMGLRTGSAMKSEMGNRLGATLALEDRLKASGTKFKEGSNMAKFTEAVRSGRTTFEFTNPDGTVITRDVSEFAGRENIAEFTETMTADSGGRITERELARQERDTFANEEQIVKNELGDPVGRMQIEEARRKVVAPRIAEDLRVRMRNAGGDPNASSKELEILSGRIGEHILTSTDPDDAKITAITAMLRDSGLYAGASEEDLKFIAASQLSSTNMALDEAGLPNRVALSQQNSAGMRSQFEAEKMRETIDARRDEAMSGLGQNTSVIQRMVQAVQKNADGKPPDAAAIQRALYEAFGGVAGSDVRDALIKPLEDFAGAQAEFNRLGDEMVKLGVDEEISDKDSPEVKERKRRSNAARAAARQGYEQASQMLGAAQEQLNEEMRKHAGIAGVLDTKTDAERTADAATGGKPAAGDSASTGPAHMEITGTLTLNRDGTATLTSRGSGRGAVPTGVA